MSFFAMSQTTPGPISILGTDLGNVSTDQLTTYDFTVTIPSGGAYRAIFALVTIYDDSGTGVVSSVTLDPAGDNLSLTESAGGSTVARHTPDIWSARLGSTNGSVTLRVTATEGCNSCAVSVVVCDNVLQPTSPTFSGVGTVSGSTSLTVASVTSEAGGITMGCAVRDEQGNTFTWGSSLTEQSDVSTGGGGQDHRHTVGYDLQTSARSASTETVTLSSNDDGSLVVASFR